MASLTFGKKLTIAGGKRRRGKKGLLNSKKKNASIFAEAENEADEELLGGERAMVNAGLVSQQREVAARKRRRVEELHKEALAQDASIFDYDGVYDEMKKKSDAESSAQADVPKKSKYVENFMATAKRREMETERVKERLLQKETKEEDALYGEATEKFVTGAYKKKLEERRQWDLEEAKRALEEEREDVTKKGNMNSFYSSMLNKLSRADASSTSDNPEKKRMQVPSSSADSEVKRSSASPLKTGTITIPESSSSSSSRPFATAPKVYEVGQIQRKMEAAAKSRRAPPRRTTPQEIKEARMRALRRRAAREALRA